MAIVDEIERHIKKWEKIHEEAKKYPGTEKELRKIIEYMYNHTACIRSDMEEGKPIDKASDIVDFLKYAIEISLLCKKLYNVDIDEIISWTNDDIRRWTEKRNFNEYIKLQKEI